MEAKPKSKQRTRSKTRKAFSKKRQKSPEKEQAVKLKTKEVKGAWGSLGKKSGEF